MQDSQTDPDNCRRLGVDEQYIKFRPSPNFKNMKKFLKSKIDYSESSSQSPPNGNSEQTTPNTAPESPPREKQMDRRSPVKQVVHPPLPLEPPPPDTPPIMPVPIKNEIIDSEYPDQENGLESPSLTKTEPEEVSLRLSFDSSTHEPDSTSTEKPKDKSEEKKPEVCRDFIRGTCTRAGTCRYLHQRDLSQLTGIYTFCRNFQNAVCTLPVCKYVHATVFEEQEFYRTGALPPHVQIQIQMIQNHLKKPFYMLPPPPPPPPEDPDNCRRLGVDEQYIKFRPSPNFKNMKKFLKSKIDYSESSSQSPPNGNSEQTTPNTAPESPPREKQMDRRSPVKQVVHPPLPLEPPPPDTPPIMPVPIKNEIIDSEYPDQENGLESPSLTKTEPEEVSLRLSFDSSTHEPDSTSTEKPKDKSEEKKPEVCRDFIRGTCTRAGTCRYLHQRDLSQLTGIYTFCRNFQNAVCTLPVCKYVHATVFEEQEFYRTGALPPHVQIQIQMIQNHLKKPFYMLPPPPPPPPEEPPREVQNACALSPPNSAEKPLISWAPVSKLESKPADNDFRNMLQAITSPLKRDWSIGPFSTPPRDLDNKENHAKKCKNCDNTDIRLQYNKEKLEKMAISTKELRVQSQALTKKTNDLYTVLYSLIKQEATTVAGMEKLKAIMIMSGEKEKAVLRHIMENNRPHFSSMM